MPLIEGAVDRDPSFLQALAGFASSVHSPVLALKKLGLSHHPSAVRIQGYRDPLIAKIIYHCDPKTLYAPAPAWNDIAPAQPPNPGPGTLQDGSGSGAGLRSTAGSASRTGSSGTAGSNADPNQSTPGLGSLSRVVMAVPPAAPAAGSQPASASSASHPKPVLDALERLEEAEAQAEASADHVASAFNGAMGDIFKSHILRSFATLVEDSSEDKQPSSLEGKILSARLSPTAVETLTFLRDDVPGSLTESPEEIGAAIAQLSRRGWTFFQLVRKGVSDIVTPLNLRLVFKRSDWAIQPLAVLASDRQLQTMTVTPEDKAINVVLSLDALPLETLLRLYMWETRAELQYFLDVSQTHSQSDAMSKALPVLLADLLAEGGFFLQGGDPDFEAKSGILESMQTEGIVQCGQDRAWQLTEQGKKLVKVGQVVGNYKRVVRARDIALADMEVAELMLSLHMQGWRHEAVHPKRCDAVPYVHGDGAKVWYHDVAKHSVSREYLLLLATSGEHKLPVPHLQAQRVYDEMLGKESRPPAKRSGDKIVFLESDDLWVDESTLVPSKPKRLRCSKMRGSPPEQDALLDGFPTDVDMAGVEAAAVEDDTVGDEQGQPALANDEAGEEPQAGKPSSSSSSSSDSDSSAEGSESDSSSSSSSSASAQTRAAPARARRGKKDMSSSVMWGRCRLTPTKTGWQMTCGHPQHNPASATALCTKTRSNAIAGEEAALRMLKAWALWGRTTSTKAAHQGVWKRVAKAWKDSTLPSMRSLDADPVQDYPASA